MLTGQYQRSLDSKSRVTLPAILRKQFGEFVQLIPRKDALYGYTPESFEAWVNSLNLDPRSRNDAETLLRLNAMATTVEIDSAGRVALGKIDETTRGQRQRLAIARALAKKPEVVVFDDSFSALDYKTDARLREELAKNVTDAALVVVAQRIATIMHADQIIVLDDGHVVGTGTHEELLHNCPAYLEIAQSQLSAEELGLTQEEIAAVMEGGER